MLVGALAARRMWLGYAGLALFACLGVAAAVTRHGASPGYAVPTVVGALAGAFALYRLIEAAELMTGPTAVERGSADRGLRAPRDLRATGGLPPIVFEEPRTWDDDPDGPAPPGGAGEADRADKASRGDRSADADELRAPDLPPGGRGPGEVGRGPGRAGPVPARVGTARDETGGPVVTASADRRSFLVTAGVTVAAAAIGEVAGRSFATRKNVSVAQQAVRFPRAAVKAPPLPAGVNLPIPGISPFITPNGQFYRVDTALVVPQVDPSELAAAHPRHGGARDHHQLRRAAAPAADRGLHHPVPACPTRSAARTSATRKWLGASLAVAAARGRAAAPAPTSCSARRWTGSPPARRWPGGARRPGRAGRGGDERRRAAGRARVPGPAGGARPVRVRVGVQVGGRHRGDDVRGGPRLLGTSAAGRSRRRSRPSPASTCRPAAQPGHGGPDRGGRGGLGAAQGHRGGRGPGRQRAVARGHAGRGARHRHLAAVGLGVGRDPRART